MIVTTFDLDRMRGVYSGMETERDWLVYEQDRLGDEINDLDIRMVRLDNYMMAAAALCDYLAEGGR